MAWIYQNIALPIFTGIYLSKGTGRSRYRLGSLGNTHFPYITFHKHVYYCTPCMEAPGKRGFWMNWQGWIFMIAAWTFIGGIFLFSFKRILFNSKPSHDNQDKKQQQKVRD
jgi:hypothetical protein